MNVTPSAPHGAPSAVRPPFLRCALERATPVVGSPQRNARPTGGHTHLCRDAAPEPEPFAAESALPPTGPPHAVTARPWRPIGRRLRPCPTRRRPRFLGRMRSRGNVRAVLFRRAVEASASSVEPVSGKIDPALACLSIVPPTLTCQMTTVSTCASSVTRIDPQAKRCVRLLRNRGHLTREPLRRSRWRDIARQVELAMRYEL